MRIGRATLAAACTIALCAPGILAQRGPAEGTAAVRIEAIAPATVTTSKDPVEVTITGRGFAQKAAVRVRRAGDRGNGADAPTTVDSATKLRATVPAAVLDRAGTLELRVRNADGGTSDWATLDVRNGVVPPGGGGSDPGSRKPVVERVSPERLEANSRSLHITVYGRDLADGAVLSFRAGSTQAQAAGNLVNGALVVPVPDELLAKPQSVIFTVRNPGGGVSDQVKIEVVPASGPPAPGDTNDPTITSVDPQRADMRGVPSQRFQILAKGVDLKGVRVLLRSEGSGEAGKVVPTVDRAAATNGALITVAITTAMVRESGFYELRLVNPNGRQSNWVRIEVVNADPGVGNTGAAVDAKFPESLTLTAISRTVPVEVTIRNTGRSTVRVSSFAVVSPDGARSDVAGSVDAAAGETKQIRLDAPVPFTAPKTAARVQLALLYKLTLVSSRNPSFDGRSPEDGFALVNVRNEIDLVDIGREFTKSDTAPTVEGWRFFKTANEQNAGSGKAADFYLFAGPFGARDGLPTEEISNYRPDESVANNRGLFYLTLKNGEISQLDARTRERGTRLGYVVTREAPGLVPLYRWALSDGRRTVNHYLTVEKDAAKLPRQTATGGWKLDGVVGYVIPRAQ